MRQLRTSGPSPGPSWEADAAPSTWLQPGERILWRGRPARLVVTRQDLVIVPMSLAFTGYALFWEHGALTGTTTFAVTDIPILLVAAYLLVGRFFTRTIGRRRTLYAITDQRVLVIKQGGRVSRELPLTTPVRVARGGRRGLSSLFFEPDPVEQALHGRPRERVSTVGRLFLVAGVLDGGRTDVVTLVDVGGLDGVNGLDGPLAALRHARPVSRFFDQDGAMSADRPVRLVARPVRSTAPVWSSDKLPSPVLERTRRLFAAAGVRDGYELWTPLAADDVRARLTSQLRPAPYLENLRSRPWAVYGSVSGSTFKLRSGRRGPSSADTPWSLVLRGSIAPAESGTWLESRVGVPASVLVAAAVWVSLVLLFFFGGLVALVMRLAWGESVLDQLPFAVIPLVLLAVFGLFLVSGTRAAKRDWLLVDRWLRSLLDAP